MGVTRLQGKDWQRMKEHVTPVSYSVSDKGRIRVEYRGVGPMLNRIHYCHWLNPDEIAAFDKSTLPLTVWKQKRRTHERVSN